MKFRPIRYKPRRVNIAKRYNAIKCKVYKQSKWNSFWNYIGVFFLLLSYDPYNIRKESYSGP